MPSVLQSSPTSPARRRSLQAALWTCIATSASLAGCADRRLPRPDFPYILLDGSQHDSASLRGRVVLVNFWATTCAVCLREMPRLAELQRQLPALHTLAVAMRYDPPARVVDYAQRNALPFGVVIDLAGEIAGALGGVAGTPTTVVLDKQGREALRLVGEPDFDTLRQRLQSLQAEA